MNSAFTILLLSFALLASCDHTQLIEISDKITDTSCLRSAYSAVLVRGYLSTGMVDPNLKSNLNKMLAANFDTNIYMNPCVKCGNPAGQADAMFAAIGTGMPEMATGIYVFGDQWGADKQANKEFILKLVESVMTTHRSVVFIITNNYQWEKIVGESVSELRATVVMYVNIDHKQTCEDYDPIGCWNVAFAKKYESDKALCGHKVGVMYVCRADFNGLRNMLNRADA